MTQSLIDIRNDRTESPVTVAGHWIWSPERTDPAERAHCLFRKTFTADEAGGDAVLRISADSRYKAWLNGELISRGPCRGIPDHYHFEVVPLAGRLRGEGPNVLAVEVRWYGEHAPVAEAHIRPGLWVMIGPKGQPGRLLADESFRTRRLDAHAVHPHRPTASRFYCMVDASEDVDCTRIPVGWQEVGYDDADWSPAALGCKAVGRYQPSHETIIVHELLPRPIPPMEESPGPAATVQHWGTIDLAADPHEARQVDGALRRADGPLDELAFETPGTHFVVLNMGELTTGYPRLTVEAPAGAVVEFRYAEALSHDFQKTVRSDPTGEVEGYWDTFFCGDGRTVVEPFMWRTYRYLRIAVHHPAGAVRLSFESVFTGYPFEQRARFESSNPLHRTLWDVSWRTARLCAHEHYEDCPYYEQMQYVGDTRLQALISYLVAGDFRLANQALHQFASSRRSDGMILSRTPTNVTEPQIIPTFALIWIGFLEDYYRHSGDAAIVRHLWGYVESILAWFEPFAESGVAIDTPYWCFGDWSYRNLPRSGPQAWPCVAGSTGEVNLRWLGALHAAARLAEAIDRPDRTEHYERRAETLGKAIRETFWSDDEQLFCDEPDGRLHGEHPSILAILHGLVTGDEASALMDRIAARDDLARTTIYYSFYTFRAYAKLGRYADVYRDRLSVWTDMLALDATTWFETPEPTRSDCHAWGAWIMCDLLTEVLGVQPAKPGYAEVRIQPTPLDLDFARGAAPTVRGPVEVDWKRDGETFVIEIVLPAGVTGTYVAPDGSQHPLASGKQRIVT